MQYIPPFLSQIIDMVAFGREAGDLAEDWYAWKQDFSEYYERESDHSLSSEDATVIQNIPPLLEQLEGAVERAFDGECSPDDLVRYSVDFFEAHDSFFEEREKKYFVDSPALDRLLKVAIANLQGNADIQAVLKRAPDAAMAVAEIQTLYQDTREELPQVLVDGTVEGFKRAQKGLDMLAEIGEGLTREQLDEVTFEIRSAGELLEHVPNLFNRFQEEQGSPIPIIGPLINVLREADDEQQLSILREHAMPDFLSLWAGRQDGWMLDPDHAYELIGAADEAIVSLDDLLVVYPEREDDFWDTVEHLEELFFQFQDHTISTQELRSSSYWPEAQLVLNLLNGGAPHYAAQTIVQGIRGGEPGTVPTVIQNLADCLSEFLEQPEPLPLLRALKILGDDFHLSRTTRPCQCGARMPLEAKSCSVCGAQVEEFTISG